MRKIKLQKIVGNLMDKLRKLHKWNGHLEILSLPQGIENSRQFLLLRTDISRKRVFGYPCMVPEVSISARELIVITNWSKSNAELFIQSILYTRHFQWRRDSNALSLSFVVSFFTQRTPQTKTNITEKTDGFTDGTKSKSRWDFEEFEGFIFFNSIWIVVFYSHPKTAFWGEVARIKWSFEIGPKRHECYILYCYSWRVATIAVDLPHSHLLALH